MKLSQVFPYIPLLLTLFIFVAVALLSLPTAVFAAPDSATQQLVAKKKTVKKRQAAPRPIAPPAGTVQAHEYNEDETDNLAAYNKEKADDLLMNAMGLLGVSYRWGGTKPSTGLDCSGFIQYVFRQAWNVNLPRTSSEMAKVGIPVAKSDLQPGDLVFFSRYGRRVGHVGMYIGDGKFIHAPSTGKKIQIANLDKAYYVKHYVGARRVTKRTN